MTHAILFDPDFRDRLLPLSATRPVADCRVGLLTIREKWLRHLKLPCSTLTAPYLRQKYPLVAGDNNLLINGAVMPTDALVPEVLALAVGEGLMYNDQLVALRTSEDPAPFWPDLKAMVKHRKVFDGKLHWISSPWQIFSHNGVAIKADIALLDLEPNPEQLSDTNTLIGDEVYIEEGATVEGAILNSDTGPIYIGKEAIIMEGAMIRGPFAVGEHAVVKMGAKIYGPTTLGPYCKVGGEVNNAVFFGYSNKAHDGFLGNSVIGEWCNLGADTNNSNLKNNYAEVKLWSYPAQRFIPTGLQFCGLIMGDHSKCAINTMFNTGTVVGVFANIFGAGFPRNFIPDFSWGGPQKMTTYQVTKAFEVAERVMARRQVPLTEKDKQILQHIFDTTTHLRNF